VIVVDTNVLAYAVLPGDSSTLVDRVAAHDPDWIAPPFWRLELANLLATAIRARGLSLDGAVAAFSYAERLVSDADLDPSIDERLEMATRGGVSAYDAEFVLVAEKLDLLLITADRRLARAFPSRVRRIDQLPAGDSD
jgi:predicted nucleic acid-binding protein